MAAPPDSALASLSERDLAHIWEGQRFPPEALSTTGGEPLRVVFRGRRGRGPGPDFRDAVIRSPSRVLRGDVELHVRASDFRRHGHHRDRAYDAVSLHLVLWADEPDTRLASGRRVSVAALAPWLERRSAEIRGWLERPALWEEPCRSAPTRLGGEAIVAVLERLGDLRFRSRVAEMRRALSRRDADEVLYGALMEGLGYGGNREAFRALAERLPWRALRPALLRLPPERRPGLALEALETAAASPPPIAWRTAGLRPGNHPAPRLQAAAGLAARYADEGLVEGLAGSLPGDAPNALAALVVRRYGRSLLGRGRALELLTNAVLPFLAARGGERRERALEIYRSLGRPAAYGSVRHLDEAVGGAVRVDARRQQGMLFLLRNYCSRGRCGSCPLS